MAIDKDTYAKGVKGLLTESEINSLPRDYEAYKPMFSDALRRKTNVILT